MVRMPGPSCVAKRMLFRISAETSLPAASIIYTTTFLTFIIACTARCSLHEGRPAPCRARFSSCRPQYPAAVPATTPCSNPAVPRLTGNAQSSRRGSARCSTHPPRGFGPECIACRSAYAPSPAHLLHAGRCRVDVGIHFADDDERPALQFGGVVHIGRRGV